MLRASVVALLVTCSGAALAAQRQTATTLSQRCALASVLIRDNRCGPISCDEGLGRALRAGCHIHHWGHMPR
jgi:hypothetical protein